MHSARSLIASALLVVLFATAVIGQRAEAWGDSVQRLHALAMALRDSMVRGDSTTQEVARRGGFVIAASAGNREIAAAALTRFAETVDRWFGGAMPFAGGFRIVVATEAPPGPGLERSGDFGSVVLAAMPDTGNSTRLPQTVAPREVADALIDIYGDMMFTGIGAVSLWLHDPPKLSTPTAVRRQWAMYALVTGTGHAARECAGGDAVRCAYALQVRQPPPGESAPVFPVPMRADLVLTALAIGGHNAWTRLRAAADSGVEPALVAAAAMPLDSLLARWRAGLLSMRPADGPINTSLGISAVLWSAAFLLAALGASRWA